MTDVKTTQVIVVGNEKGGSGKTTVAMHLIVALLQKGYEVGAVDLDVRQKSLSRYLQNRASWGLTHGIDMKDLPFPQIGAVPASTANDRHEAHRLESQAFAQAMSKFATCDYLVIDTPGADTGLSRLAHMHADTIITPMNDSFVDFALLAEIDPGSEEIIGPSTYAETVWKARQTRAQAGVKGGIEWIVMRNRLGAANAKNRIKVGKYLSELASRIGFTFVRGFGERVIYRELFNMGLTLLDLSKRKVTVASTMRVSSVSHVAARQEVRAFLANIKNIGRDRETIPTRRPGACVQTPSLANDREDRDSALSKNARIA